MVSTRGVKLKFFEGERVLCYEPDPTKAKVLYDSKVLDIIINKDHRGRKTVEYLIHFQGWNSSWDRCVGEEFVLKDTPENRQLQKDLAEKAQLQLGAYLYRRERKKHNRKLSERVAQSSEDGSSAGSPVVMDTDDGQDQSTSSEEDSSADEELVQIEITNDLKDALETDYNFINNKNKLVKLPADPNVITILENFWKHYVTSQMCGLNIKPNTRYRQPFNNHTKLRPEDLQRNLNLCKEAIDGIRIYFDFILNDLLLYKSEKNRIESGIAHYTSMLPNINVESNSIKNESDENELNRLTNSDNDYENCNNHQNEENNCVGKPLPRRRGLRSQRIIETNINGNQTSDTNNTKPNVNSIPELPPPVIKELSWHLLPSYVYNQQPSPPSLIYGAIHLTRLFIKLPELLSASSIDENKLKVLLPYFELIIFYLNSHKEWFGEKNYIDL